MPTALKDSNDTAAAAIAAGRDPGEALRERLRHRRAVEPVATIEPKVKPWPALDAKAYHGIVGELVRQIEPHTESDPAAVLQTVKEGADQRGDQRERGDRQGQVQADVHF